MAAATAQTAAAAIAAEEAEEDAARKSSSSSTGKQGNHALSPPSTAGGGDGSGAVLIPGMHQVQDWSVQLQQGYAVPDPAAVNLVRCEVTPDLLLILSLHFCLP